MNDSKLSKKNSEVKTGKTERKYCGPSRAFTDARKAFNRADRKAAKQLCRKAA